MDILAVILSGLSLVVATIILIITLKKGNASSGGGITQSDIDKINESEAKELEKLSKFIASGISSTNLLRYLTLSSRSIQNQLRSVLTILMQLLQNLLRS